jgi:hypothetical protein
MTLCMAPETGGIRSSDQAMRSSSIERSFAQRIASALIPKRLAIPTRVSHDAILYDLARSRMRFVSPVGVGLVLGVFFICVTVSKSVLTSPDLFI